MLHTKFRECLAPFTGNYSSGPVYDSHSDRLIIKILGTKVNGKKRAQTYLYSRYLYCVFHNKITPKGYDVDHKDGNKNNDTIGNLQLLPMADNRKKDKRPPRIIQLTCPHCLTVFNRLYRQTHLAKKGKATFCSRNCGRYSYLYPGISQNWSEVTDKPSMPLPRISEPWEQWSKPLISAVTSRPREKKYTVECSSCRGMFKTSNKKDRYCSQECKKKGNNNIKEDKEGMQEILIKACNKEISWVMAGRLLGMSDNTVRNRARSAGLLR